MSSQFQRKGHEAAEDSRKYADDGGKERQHPSRISTWPHTAMQDHKGKGDDSEADQSKTRSQPATTGKD